MPRLRAARRTLLLRFCLLGIVVGVAFGAAGVLAHPAATAPQPTIAVDVDASSSGVQSDAVYTWGIDEIAIAIVVTDAQPTGAFEFEMAFDTSVLSYRRTVAGPFIGSTGRLPACVELSQPATVRYGCGTIGAPPPAGASGDGVLALVYVHPIVPARTCFSLLRASTATVDGDAIDTGKQDACLTVAEAGATPTSTAAAADTATSIPTETATSIASSTSTSVATATDTPASTPTEAATAAATSTSVPTETATSLATSTSVATATDTPISNPTETATAVATNTSTSVPTATPSASSTITSVATATSTTTATATQAPASATPTATGTTIATATASAIPGPLGRALAMISEIRDRLCGWFGNTSSPCRALSRVLTRVSLRLGGRFR